MSPRISPDTEPPAPLTQLAAVAAASPADAARGSADVPAGPGPAAAARLAHLLRLLGAGAWIAGRLAAVAVARTLTWFAEEPRRIRIASAGLLLSAVIGTVAGVGIGLALAAVIHAALGLVVSTPT